MCVYVSACYLGDVCSRSCTQRLWSDGLSRHEHSGLAVSGTVQLPPHTHTRQNYSWTLINLSQPIRTRLEIETDNLLDQKNEKQDNRWGLRHGAHQSSDVTCAASYVMVLVSVWTMGTSLVVISVFWAANVSEMVTISVFTTGGYGISGRKVSVSLKQITTPHGARTHIDTQQQNGRRILMLYNKLKERKEEGSEAAN